jgi:UDP:flavonoid glycosyltransferase YjiC (YdhE family)
MQPLLGFGAALASLGHEVRFATHPKFEPMVRGMDLDFAPLAEGQVSQGPDTAEGRRWMALEARGWPAWLGILQDARSVARRRLADAVAACEGAEAIVAVELAMLLGWQMAERCGVPLVRVRLTPPPPRAGSPLAGVVREAAWLAMRPWLRAVRRDVGLAPLPPREPLGQLERRRTLELCAFSPAVVTEPARAGRWTHITGYWFLDRDLDPEPPAGLEAFLAAGPAPVCVDFGSMIDPGPASKVVAALVRAGQRGVLLRGLGGLRGVELPDEVFGVDAVAHAWLFGRCAAVVHHGGAGTTAAALRAGVPSVVVPHMIDQSAWGRRMHALGAGPAPIRRRRLSMERLHAAIEAAVTDPEIRESARALGERIRGEDGIARATDAFQRHLTHDPEPSPVGVTNG